MEINCTRAHEKLLVLGEEEILQQENSALLRHLQACPRCAKERTAWNNVTKDIYSGAEFAPNKEFFEDWQLDLSSAAPVREKPFVDLLKRIEWLFIPQPAVRYAALAVLIVSFMLIWSRNEDLKSSSVETGLPNRLILHHSYMAVSENQGNGYAFVKHNSNYNFSKPEQSGKGL